MEKEQIIAYPQFRSYMKSHLTYSQISGIKPTIEEIKKDILSIDLDTALIILSKLSVLSRAGKEKLKLKLKPLTKVLDLDIEAIIEPYDLTNIMYTIKWFLAYGENRPTYEYNEPYPEFLHVFLTLLKITDYMVESIDNYDKAEDFIFKSSLFNRDAEVDKALVRQEIMFNILAMDKTIFEGKEKNYIDINEIFEKNYGYTLIQYVSTLFALNTPCIKELCLDDIITSNNWGIDITTFFNSVADRQTALKITEEISIDVSSLKKWALRTINSPFDNEEILATPLFKSKTKVYPFSPSYMAIVMFEGLSFKINKCCRKEKKDYFTFFGKIFESYVSRILEKAINDAKIKGYTYMREFKFGKENKDSSDAYILLGKTLLIIECKSGSIKKEAKTQADSTISNKAFQKYALSPIKQANDAFEAILNESTIFDNIKKVYILSVSLQSFPRITKYHKLLKEEDFVSTLNPKVKFVDYIGLSELELIANILNNHNKSVFKILNHKKQYNEYLPYQHYYYQKYGNIRRTDYMTRELKITFEKIKNTFQFKKM
ncbi:hypothetical protein P4483_12240 [Bacillus thuringiensis]|nr:hypothetical protein [Bacillus thuringiensis]